MMATDKDSGESPDKTLLLDVMQAIGRVEGQNQLILAEQSRAADGRKEQYKALDQIRADASEVKGKITAIADRVSLIEPDVKNMKAFRSQLALSWVFVTAAVTGAINLIWIAVTHMGEIKEALRNLLK